MKRRRVNFKLIIAVIVMMLSLSVVSFAAGTSKAGEWKENSGGVWYQYPDGRIAYSNWIVDYDNNKKYHINDRGFMDRDGWVLIDGVWSLFDYNGDIVTGWHNTKAGRWLYSDGTGNITNGWVEVGGKSYYFDSDGVMKTGWLEENSDTYLLGDDGALITSKWVTDAVTGNTYYLNSKGAVSKGAHKVDGKTYNFDWVTGVWQK